MRVTSRTNEAVDWLAEFISASDDMVAFTGAGISTESGIPDFRSPGSAWLRNKPIAFKDFLESEEARAEAWRRKFRMDESFRDARPGRGHAALTGLAATHNLSQIITQNIDGLHQKSGLSDDHVIELHGNGTHALCLTCGHRFELEPIRVAFESSGIAPRCECGGIVKAATISFGQAMPAQAMARARRAAQGCDLFIAIGTSLVVFPAAVLPVMARDAGARLIIINREPTRLDDMADAVLRGEIGDILGAFPEAGRLN